MQFTTPRQATDQQRVNHLVRLWNRVPSAVAHPAGCACGRDSLGPVDMRVIEDEILDDLHGLYEGRHPTLAAVIEGRRAQLIGLSAADTFETWIGHATHLPEQDRGRLFDDLQRALESFPGTQGARFACS